MVASGNDFVVIENSYPTHATAWVSRLTSCQSLAKKICDRKFGVGADGLLFLEKSKIADVKMRIFNPDGSEAQMCGNGARCVALYMGKPYLKIQTKAGIIEAEVKRDNVNPVRNTAHIRANLIVSNGVKIKLTDPKEIKLDIPIKINNRLLKVNFINTGVPHTVISVEGLDEINVVNLGRQIRYHQKFKPSGTNVDFVEALSNNSIKIRTYERGVEDETLACGTGAVASALILATRYSLLATKINVQTKSQEILKVYFDKISDKFRNVWLEGKAKIAYKGCWCDYK